MNKVYSKYKILGGFGLLLALNVMVGFAVYQVIFASKLNYQEIDLANDPGARLIYGLVIGFQMLFLFLLATQNRYIISAKDHITFINPILPFLRRTRTWDAYDYWVMVEEDAADGSYEAIWLIKNGRIKDRFSSFYYVNYNQLKRNIEGKVRSKGTLRIGPVKQLAGLLGFKIT